MDVSNTYIGTVIFFNYKTNEKMPCLYINKDKQYSLSYNIEELIEKFDNKRVKVIAIESPDNTTLWASDVKEI